jgi:hypothetical protein
MHSEHRSIGELAYRLWQARGCPEGSPEQDWLDAERQIKAETPTLTTEVVRSSKPDGEQSSKPPEQTTAKISNRPRIARPRAAQSKPSGGPAV